jgi:hypothetical protein
MHVIFELTFNLRQQSHLEPLCALTLVFNSSKPTQFSTTHLSAAQTTLQRAGWLFAQDKRGRTISQIFTRHLCSIW